MESPRWHICATAAEVRQRAVKWITDAATEAIAVRGMFRIVLAGGDTPRSVYEDLRGITTDWGVWQIWFSDERCFGGNDSYRNSQMAQETLLRQVPVLPEQVHPIRVELGVERAAAHYRADLQDVPEFDLVLLGLGEDGHTASLFHGGDWGEDHSALDAFAIHNAPKPPAERVSLSAQRLANTRRMLFLVTGANKCAAVRTWRCGGVLPAAVIRPPAGVDVLVEKICVEG